MGPLHVWKHVGMHLTGTLMLLSTTCFRVRMLCLSSQSDAGVGRDWLDLLTCSSVSTATTMLYDLSDLITCAPPNMICRNCPF
eukprot:1159001-Pelagomonas_calceolata.AAC.11